MTDSKSAYASYYMPSNATVNKKITNFDFDDTVFSTLQHEVYQEHKPYSGDASYDVGIRNIFGRDDYSEEPVGRVFFSERNIKRLQKKIKEDILQKSKNKFVLEEDQDAGDILVAMRAVYEMHGRFLKENIVHQVKDLNDKLVSFVVPDMMTQIKQYYGYLKDVNEPIKPIDRPMNVSSAGRRALPSITTMWSRF